MTWRPDLAGGCEAAKIAPTVVRYLQGKCLDIGSGPGKVWPRLIGIDTAHSGGRPVSDLMMDGTDLSMFGDATMDGVFSSFLLQQIDRTRVAVVLAEWMRVLKIGGHFVLYLPVGVPLVGEEGADPAQKWNVEADDVAALLDGLSDGWTMLEDETRQDGDEFGHLWVLRKEAASVRVRDLWQRNPGGKKRALVIRYGAVGDSILAASVFPGLKKQGYHLTVNCRPSTQSVLLHDPHVDEWLIQADDFVPNEVLGPYWRALNERYDHVVNLCESIEGLLLTLPGRLNHGYSDAARRALYDDVNYMEHTHNIAAVPHEFTGRFYMTAREKEKAMWDRRKMNGPVVVWVVNGSSAHKVWPWVQVVAEWLLKRTPSHVVLFADPGPVGSALVEGIAQCLIKDGADMSRVHAIGGKWELRRALTFCHVVDCVVGPETGPLNVASMADVPKVLYLSHSSRANLTKHWRNTVTLEPERAKVPCWPCHRLHYNWEFCTQDEGTNAALCASSISPERVFKAIAEALGAVIVPVRGAA